MRSSGAMNTDRVICGPRYTEHDNMYMIVMHLNWCFCIILQAQDLALLMRNLEHWAHRLFPKMPFDEVLERVERLGAKREVQVEEII